MLFLFDLAEKAKSFFAGIFFSFSFVICLFASISFFMEKNFLYGLILLFLSPFSLLLAGTFFADLKVKKEDEA